MPRDPRKHQQALMKKRSKQKAAEAHRSHQQASMALSAPAILRRARTYPLFECLISADWEGDDLGLVELLLSRRQPDGDICYGVYLVDKFCLGLKNTFAHVNYSPARYQDEVYGKIFHGRKTQECPIELAHQMIYASIEYAAQFGFQPHKDFEQSQYLLLPRGELEEPYKLTFGKDGKPFYVAGPRDNAARILKQLEKSAGPGNYHYVVGFGDL